MRLVSDQTPPVPDPMQWDEVPDVIPTETPQGNPNPKYSIDKVSMKAVLAPR